MATADDDVTAVMHSQAAMPIAVTPITASLPDYVVDDSLMRKQLPELRQHRWEERGTRINPEPPRLVAKVCQEEGRGELWLGCRPSTHSQADVNFLRNQAQYTDLLLCRRYRKLYSGQEPGPKRDAHPRSTCPSMRNVQPQHQSRAHRGNHGLCDQLH